MHWRPQRAPRWSTPTQHSGIGQFPASLSRARRTRISIRRCEPMPRAKRFSARSRWIWSSRRARSAAAQLQKATLLMGFNRRFDPHFQALKTRLDAGAIGRLETLSIVSHDPAPPPIEYIRVSGGLFKDMAIHDFDTARWLLNEEPEEVFSSASCLVDPAIAGAATWTRRNAGNGIESDVGEKHDGCAGEYSREPVRGERLPVLDMNRTRRAQAEDRDGGRF